MGNLKDYRSSAPRIIGSTTINHEMRVNLGLNCSEYCFLDHMSRKQEKNEMADTLTVYTHTGFTEKDQQGLLKGLILKGFIFIESGNKIKITDRWYDAFPDIEKEFDVFFWHEIIDDKKVVAWTGTKKKALEYYIKLRKKYSKDYLVLQRNHYFEYLRVENKRGFARQRMMCQAFLNPANERFAEDYKDYADQIRKKFNIQEEIKTEPVTIDKVKEAYGKNNNK